MQTKTKACILVMILTILSFEIVLLLALSSVDTTVTSSGVTGDTPQRKTFYDEGRYWVFYSSGTKMGFKSSTDDSSWTAFNTIYDAGAGLAGYTFSIYFDTAINYVSYLRSNIPASGSPIFWRRGNPNSDGTISWETERTAVALESGVTKTYGTVTIDSNGYPWVAYSRYDVSGYNPRVRKATATDGSSWGTDWELDSTDGTILPTILPLASGKMYAIWVYYTPAEGSRQIRGKKYDGTSWDTSATTIDSNVLSYGYCSSVSNGNDEVYLAYVKGTTYNVCYRKWTEASGWSGETILEDVDKNNGVTVSISLHGSEIHVYWRYNTYIYRRVYIGSWQSRETIVSGETNLVGGTLTVYYKSLGNPARIGMVWVVGTASPWTVRHHYVTMNPLPTNLAISILNMDDTNNLYAQLRWYQVSYNVSDDSGYADITYMQFSIKQASALRATFRFTEDTNTFSIQYGSDKWDLDASGSSYTKTGIYIYTIFKIMNHWDAVEESAIELEMYVIDSVSGSDNDTTSNYADIVTNLLVQTIECTDLNDPDRVDVSWIIQIDVTVRYANNPSSSTATTFYPPDSEFNSISIHDPIHVVKGTDNSIVNGIGNIQFTSSSEVESILYHAYIDMADADYSDGDESPTEQIITDRIHIQVLEAIDERINVNTYGTWYATAILDYDAHVLGADDSFTLSDYGFSWVPENNRYETSVIRSFVTSITIDTYSSGFEDTYGISAGICSLSKTIIWDRIRMLTLIGDPTSLSTGSYAKINATGELEYDGHALGNGDSLTMEGLPLFWNASESAFLNFEKRDTAGSKTYDEGTGNEATYGITVLSMNGLSVTVTWQALGAPSDPVGRLQIEHDSSLIGYLIGYRGYDIKVNASLSLDPDGGSLAWYWFDFGDGSSPVNGSDPVVYHAYASVGNYTVTLQVEDDEGAQDSFTFPVQIREQPTLAAQIIQHLNEIMMIAAAIVLLLGWMYYTKARNRRMPEYPMIIGGEQPSAS